MDFDFYRLERDADEKDYYALQNEWYRSMFPDEFTEDFFVEIGEDVTGGPQITNGVFFNANEYTTNEVYINKNGPDSEEGGVVEDPLGLEKDIYNKLEDSVTTIYKTNEKIPIAVEYNFKAPSDDEIYCSLVTGRILDGTEVYVNGIQISSFAANSFYSQIFRIGKFNEGDDVKVTFLSGNSSWSYLNIRFASFDNEAFSRQFAEIDKSRVTPVSVSDGYAKFDVKGMEEGDMVLTTIPAEDGWQFYVDGSPAEYRVYQNAFIAFDTGAGDHTAELVFTAPGLKAGACVSCAGVVLLAAFIVIDKKRPKKNEKQK